ncbi:Aste57867_8568 [Aphanomyces stellatus]|uniref:Histone-lysine N-methyltransferase, H3 lysine-79 specific n=1 Tax=Aphanomyces stellatus TaxID=120398 RepID=A0A485KKN3_9STRA|nr:hypothetical protein As57867_008536 [Aphanomyces stellatus]VFT85454.1 Aste57867_8568 [Aphanomyces stellatus]
MGAFRSPTVEEDVDVAALSLKDVGDDNEPHHNDTLERFFDNLYKNHPMKQAKAVSRDERRANGYISTTLTYGEIEFRHFRAVFERILKEHDVLAKPGGVFLDIGCGSGRPIFAAALLHDFDACVGYEILDGLTQVALDVASIWQHEKKSLNALKRRTRIVIEHEDATALEWPLADFVFCNSTCFDTRLMRAITKQAVASLKKGGVIVTATNPLVLVDNADVAALALVHKCKMQESWGDATLFVYKRA